MAHELRPGQVYVSCDPRDQGRRIRIETVRPLSFSVTVVTLTEKGPMRQRSLSTYSLHPTAKRSDGTDRVTGYALETR